MSVQAELAAQFGLRNVVIRDNLPKSELFRAAIANDRGRIRNGGGDDERKAYATKLGEGGPLVFYTDPTCTGRPVTDTFAVAWPEFEQRVWWKDSMKPYDPGHYEATLRRVIAHLNERRSTLYVQDLFVGVDPSYAVPFRFVGEYATHAMFAHNMFPKSVPLGADTEPRGWTMFNVPSFRCDPERDGSASDRAVILDFRNRVCLVAGRADYCGVIKKSMFTAMNFLMPERGVLSMHCAANVGARGDSALLFGLSGTGKTTLSADADRKLIGDDETCWTKDGISNIENGCYAKLIDLDKKAEPIIAAALSREGTIIENVPPLAGRPLEQTDPQDLDLTDRSITENSRFSYPLDCNPNVADGARGAHPSTIVLLTADAFGVLPPVAVLDGREVMYHFVQGFTAKVAGTEIGVKDPQATFSACFGAPFMAQHPSVYARLLRDYMERHNVRGILLNTGWSGGPAGKASRISLRDTRSLLNAALRGDLHAPDMEYATHPVFRLRVPKRCPGVDSRIMDPRGLWSDTAAYDDSAVRLRDMFRANFEKSGFAKLGIDAVL